MKGVNSTTLDETLDPGQDGLSASMNGNFARDVYGFGLHYYEGDYLAINGTGQNHIASINGTSHAAQNGTTNDLFNGNIRFMQTAITNPDTRDAMPMLNVYKYDQLNRLLSSRSYETGLANNVWNPTGYNNEYFNAFTFDANGNILTQKRHLRDGTQVEDMTYRYRRSSNGDLLRNRLYHINDAIASGVDNRDIDDMGVFEDDPTLIETANNNVRDEEGRLIRNIQEEIEEIVWRVDGKVKEVKRFSNSQKKNVSFDYDAMGNQIAKHIINNQTGILEKSTYYILDASGNQMSVYEHDVDSTEVRYTLAERQMYGSSHVGTLKATVDMYTATTSNLVNNIVGEKRYSLSDHRGNVNAVISDIKIPVSTGTTVDYFDVYIVNVADFSPFNVELDGRTIKNDFYRYSVQGQEGHDEVLGEGNYVNYKYRGYDPRVGRLDWAVDPLAYNYAELTPYQYSANELINSKEFEGLERVYVYDMLKRGEIWVKKFSHVEIEKSLVETYQIKLRYWDQDKNLITTNEENIRASQLNPNQGFYDNLIDYHILEGNYWEAFVWKVKKTDRAIQGPQGFGEGMKLVAATVGTIFGAHAIAGLSAALGKGILYYKSTVAFTSLALALDEFTGVGNKETLLEMAVRDMLGDTSAELFKGAKLFLTLKSAVSSKAEFTIKMSSGEMIEGSIDFVHATIQVGESVRVLNSYKNSTNEE